MNTKINKIKQKWIGLAHVKPKTGNNLLQGALGAFVPILALTTEIDDFVALTTTYLESFGFEVLEIEDIELFKDRLRNSDVEDVIIALAEELTDEDPIILDTFQAYDNE